MIVMTHETATTVQEHPLTSAVYPRFTPQEAMILNILASASPNPVSVSQILQTLQRVLAPSAWGGATRDSLKTAVTGIRAKLGEKKYHAKRLVTVYEMSPSGTRTRLIGYVWKG